MGNKVGVSLLILMVGAILRAPSGASGASVEDEIAVGKLLSGSRTPPAWTDESGPDFEFLLTLEAEDLGSKFGAVRVSCRASRGASGVDVARASAVVTLPVDGAPLSESAIEALGSGADVAAPRIKLRLRANASDPSMIDEATHYQCEVEALYCLAEGSSMQSEFLYVDPKKLQTPDAKALVSSSSPRLFESAAHARSGTPDFPAGTTKCPSLAKSGSTLIVSGPIDGSLTDDEILKDLPKPPPRDSENPADGFRDIEL